MASVPSEPPPPYESQSTPSTGDSTHLEVPHKTRNGIPPSARRSMEDEQRPLPSGWVRQYDSKEHHQFFVDTRSSPPRSIWQHPYDDPAYLSSLPPVERRRIQSLHNAEHQTHSPTDYEAESSAEEYDDEHADDSIGGVHKFGRKMKDKLTSSTHEEREAKRRRREEEERRAYEYHKRIREAMVKAEQTGEPQLLGKDSEGKDVYVEPPTGMGDEEYGQNAYGYNPYSQGPYSSPNARFVRPQLPYQRPYGYGYGGGFGYGPGLGMGMGMGGMGYGMPLLGLGTGMAVGGLLF